MRFIILVSILFVIPAMSFAATLNCTVDELANNTLYKTYKLTASIPTGQIEVAAKHLPNVIIDIWACTACATSNSKSSPELSIRLSDKASGTEFHSMAFSQLSEGEFFTKEGNITVWCNIRE